MTTIYQQLKREHKSVKDLLKQLESGNATMAGSRESLFSQLQKELGVHMEGEENFFYPPLRENDDARDQILEAVEEHHVARLLLGELNAMAKDDERWMAKLAVLRENIEHHIREEEREVFKAAKGLLSAEKADEILQSYLKAEQREMSTV